MKRRKDSSMARFVVMLIGISVLSLSGLAQLPSGDGWFHWGTVGGDSLPPIQPAFNLMPNVENDLVEKGMTENMVEALIGEPDESYWDNDDETCYHAVYEYEVYQCSCSISLEAGGRESSKSKIIAKYSAEAKVYYALENGRWKVYKVVGSTKDYGEYRKNGNRPIRRMMVPDDACLVERYR